MVHCELEQEQAVKSCVSIITNLQSSSSIDRLDVSSPGAIRGCRHRQTLLQLTQGVFVYPCECSVRCYYQQHEGPVWTGAANTHGCPVNIIA